jgi:surfactin synthase thioesterase subunit
MPLSGNTDEWIERKAGPGDGRLQLFCFPYAGGGASAFRGWADGLGPDLDVCAIQLPGRERRLREQPLRCAEQAVEILVDVLRPCLDRPFAFFGHSMGAILAYEVARAVAMTGGMEPRALFVSGRRAPHLPPRKRDLHNLPRDELIAELKTLNGTPLELFAHEDLVDLFMSTLRSDFELVETYRKREGSLLSCPVIAMGGCSDPDVPPQDLAAWYTVTTGPFNTMLFEGDHFYLNQTRKGLLDALKSRLMMAGAL